VCKPTFFIIGAAKCGTSSLHFYLAQHPEISMSSIKEPSVFSRPRWAARWESHAGLFDCGARVRGEASTTYSRYPIEGDAAAAISAAVPDAKLIYIVGDPVERAVSDYMQARFMGLESRRFEEAVRERPFGDSENYYLCASKYTLQLGRYLRHFDPSALLVIEQRRLRDDRAGALASVFRFLKVDPGFRSPRFAAEIGTRADQPSHDGLEFRVRHSALGRAYRRLPVGLRLRLGRARRRGLRRPYTRPSLDPDLREELAGVLGSELDGALRMAGGAAQAPAAS
jgi:hypothetical protein